jgi:heat-inducible transcriptional repressor
MQTVFEQLNDRRKTLLGLIVEDYIQTAAPVASQHLLKHPELRVSPATIRNDMAELEDLGLIARPHTSAGGVPQDLAYRFYVERVVAHTKAPRVFQVLVQDALHQDEGDPEVWAREAAGVLSQEVHNVVIATVPRAFQARLRHVQLVPVRDVQALLVLVMQESRVRQQRVNLSQSFTEEGLSALSSALNAALADKTAGEVRAIAEGQPGDNGAPRVIMEEIIRLMALEEEQEAERHYVEGLRHMLSQPEFTSGDRAREAVGLVEDADIIKQMTADVPDQGEVGVVIGNENRQEDLRHYSIVVGRYGVPGYATGTIAAMGPTRMDYARAISSVRYLTSFLSGLLDALRDSPE